MGSPEEGPIGADRCRAMAKDRRVCEYADGPAGWSHAEGDRIKLDVPRERLSEYNFVGCRADIAAALNTTRAQFTLRHELEHERQRTCASREWLLAKEYWANREAWQHVARQDLPARRLPRVCRRVDSLVCAVTIWLAALCPLGSQYVIIPLVFLGLGKVLFSAVELTAGTIPWVFGVMGLFAVAFLLTAPPFVIRRYT